MFYKRYKNIMIFLVLLIIGNMISFIRMKLIKSGQIENYGIIEITRAIIFIPVMYLLLNIIFKKSFYGKYLDILISLILLLIHEILSKFIDGIGTYDSKDVIGLIIGALFTFLLVKLNFISTKRVEISSIEKF